MSLFLSTLSLRRATSVEMKLNGTTSNFYPRSPCGERPTRRILRAKLSPISIHALLAESDPVINCNSNLAQKFLSTLSLRRATDSLTDDVSTSGFLSTLSLRRATRLWTILYSCPGNFYPRSPCGERRNSGTQADPVKSISIHALLAESD